mmetsp:Transcript_33260/g.75787  ORF Transcript_33260/g.75787 Transcript_33260/m.75787 type:complete len:997 (-) Transcript_33260:57-3047(-)
MAGLPASILRCCIFMAWCHMLSKADRPKPHVWSEPKPINVHSAAQVQEVLVASSEQHLHKGKSMQNIQHHKEDPRKEAAAKPVNDKILESVISVWQMEPEGKGSVNDLLQYTGEMTCQKEEFAPDSECPESCPFFAEDASKFCHFACVESKACGTGVYVKQASIADEATHQCRRCEIEGCDVCEPGAPGEEKEQCKKCMVGYFLTGGGTGCRAMSDFLFGAIVVVGVIGMIFFLLWYYDLRSKPVVNPEGLEQAIDHRSRMKVRQETEPGRPLYPMSTNFLTQNICGAGTLVFFRFQAAVIAWAIFMFLLQVVLGLAVDKDIFVLGLRTAEDEQEYCAVVQWGRRRQMELVWVKVVWLVVGYTTAFMGSIWYAINSRRLFQQDQRNVATMSHYCAEMRGLPRKKGSEKYEEALKKTIEDASGVKVVGVSVCWDLSDHHTHHHITSVVEDEVGGVVKVSRASQRGSVVMLLEAAAANDPEARGVCGRLFDSIARLVLAQWNIDVSAKEEAHEEHHIVEVLEGLESTEYAMVVFETQEDRDKAVQTQGITVDGAECTLTKQQFEPEGLLWEFFGVSRAQRSTNMLKGSFIMALAVVAWTFILYAPYGMYLNSFTYKNGDEPGEIGKTIFIAIVVGAQIGLFTVANQVTHHAGFHYEDKKQEAYIVLYNFALIVNLALDMTLTALLSYKIMVGRGVRTASGSLLSDLPSIQEVFESYPMQKTIGAQLHEYCFPATFLVPFAAEPFCVLFFPYHIGCLFVRSSQRVVGPKAEKALQLPVMEQGRFADMIFNAILICLVPFIAPGYILVLYGAFIFSHLYIYLYDHWRTLRCCTRYYFSSNVCNLQGLKLWSIPTGLLLMSLIFKVNQMKGKENPTTHIKELGSGPLQGQMLWLSMCGAFALHVVVHLLILAYIVPLFDRDDTKVEVDRPTYGDCCKTTPASWFSTNPAWCLRSKYIYKHQPPQVFYLIGREHKLQRNEAIGAYYEASAAVVEESEKGSVI